jgi:hypothetical protein
LHCFSNNVQRSVKDKLNQINVFGILPLYKKTDISVVARRHGWATNHLFFLLLVAICVVKNNICQALDPSAPSQQGYYLSTFFKQWEKLIKSSNSFKLAI